MPQDYTFEGGTPMKENKGMDRREFMKRTGATAAMLGLFPSVFNVARAQAKPTADQVIKGKDPRLIVHNTSTGVLETPLELLREHEITPKELLYVRNNQVLAGGKTLEPIPLKGWFIEIVGLVHRPAKIEATALKEFPQHEVTMVLQCSGNGRGFFAKYSKKTSGTQWKHGGMGQTVWKGPKLKDVLEKYKVEVYEPAAKFLTANGRDEPSGKKPDFEHSLPWTDPYVRENAILAIEMNGEPIPAVHGGPVRLIVPGYYGTMNVKWVGTLRFEAHETYNYNQIPRYRVPLYPVEPGKFSKKDYTFDNSRPNWHQKIKAVIFAPLDGEKVSAGLVRVKGVAFNDGVVPIEQVQVSTDMGKTWTTAALKPGKSTFEWTYFEAPLVLKKGEVEIWVRAVDKLGRAQPLDGGIHWNPSGYEWNGADRIKVTVS